MKKVICFSVVFAVFAFLGCENPWMKEAVAPLYKDKNGETSGDGGGYAPPSGDGGGYVPPLGIALSAASAGDWDAALAAVRGSSESLFTITVTADLSLPPQALTDAAYAGKTIVLKGDIPTRTLSLASVGSLLTVGTAGTDLTVELQSIVVQGRADNTAPLIKVNTDSTLAVKTGGKVTGNTYTTTVIDTGGGGVFVDGGTLDIAGGEISGNTVAGNSTVVLGGGILIKNGTMAMNGGSVKNNTLTNSGSGNRYAFGGGIYLEYSAFTLSSGSIEGNTITAVSSSLLAAPSGGGVSVRQTGSFIMTGGVIRDNHLSSTSANNWGASRGGGVEVYGTGASFVMQGGEIYGNTGTYNLPNTGYPSGYEHCGAYGGGVFIDEGTMQKTGGVIYGSEASGSDVNSIPYKNLIQDSGGEVIDGGQAVAYFAGTMKTAWRDTTANTGDHLDTANPPGTGGWE